MRLCLENDVRLIVVPFTIPLRDIQEFVLQELSKRSIQPPLVSTFELGVIAPSILKRLREHAESRGGQLLSERYEGSAEKLIWKCHNTQHLPFECSPSAALNSGHWCRMCASERQSQSYRVSLDQIREWARACNGELEGNTTFAHVAEETFALGDSATFHCSRCDRSQLRTIRQVRDGGLCLCLNKKTRTDRLSVEGSLGRRGFSLVAPSDIRGGRTVVTIQCDACNTTWTAVARNIINDDVGCPKCRRNAAITIEKAQELAEKLGFYLRSNEVKGGMDVLQWECQRCRLVLNKPYREMRNVRRCPSCTRQNTIGRLNVGRDIARQDGPILPCSTQ
jgi:hypothetical protein